MSSEGTAREYGEDRVGQLQARIDAALRESPEERAQTSFSPYMPSMEAAFDIEDTLVRAAARAGPGRLEGLEAALGAFDQLLESHVAERVRAQYGLRRFLAHYKGLGELGLRLPSLQDRSPWKVRPSVRVGDDARKVPGSEKESNDAEEDQPC